METRNPKSAIRDSPRLGVSQSSRRFARLSFESRFLNFELQITAVGSKATPSEGSRLLRLAKRAGHGNNQ